MSKPSSATDSQATGISVNAITGPARCGHFLAAVVSTLMSFAANSRYTFPAARDRLALPQSMELSLVLFVAIVVLSLALWLLFRLWAGARLLAEHLAVLPSTGAMFVVRLLVMSRWVFIPARTKP